MFAVASLYPCVEAHNLDSFDSKSSPVEQEKSRYPTYSPGGADMRGVTVYRIRSVLLSPEAQRKVIQIELHNSTGGWYVGGAEWFLWTGDHKFRRNNCTRVDDSLMSKTVCFMFSMEVWESLRQGEPIILTWGDSPEDRDRTAPITYLDKRLVNKKTKKKVSQPR
jgi:hypothetical protein